MWTMLDRHTTEIRNVEMSYLRGACWVTWRDGFNNMDVQEQCGVDGMC